MATIAVVGSQPTSGSLNSKLLVFCVPGTRHSTRLSVYSASVVLSRLFSSDDIFFNGIHQCTVTMITSNENEMLILYNFSCR